MRPNYSSDVNIMPKTFAHPPAVPVVAELPVRLHHDELPAQHRAVRPGHLQAVMISAGWPGRTAASGRHVASGAADVV